MSETNSKKWKYLDRKPGSVYKHLFLRPWNISARTIYGCYMNEEEPMTPEQIAEDRQIPLDAVLEAIAYCQTDPPEIREDFEIEQAMVEAAGYNDPEYRKTGKVKGLSIEDIIRIRARQAMNLYLDDDSVGTLLIRLLRQAGHDVVIPMDLVLSGSEDPVHLRRAVQLGRVFLTHNHDDFELLHLLVRETHGHHPGILAVCRDNDQKRDMKPGDIVRAIRNLTAANTTLADQLHILNHWR